jgi:hypothetical protein
MKLIPYHTENDEDSEESAWEDEYGYDKDGYWFEPLLGIEMIE